MSQLARRSNRCLAFLCPCVCGSWPWTRGCWGRDQAGFKHFISTRRSQWIPFSIPCCGPSLLSLRRAWGLSEHCVHLCTGYVHFHKSFSSIECVHMSACVCMCMWLRPMVESNPEVRWCKEGGVLPTYRLPHSTCLGFYWNNGKISPQKGFVVFPTHCTPRFLL